MTVVVLIICRVEGTMKQVDRRSSVCIIYRYITTSIKPPFKSSLYITLYLFQL